jgi:hypothetical protein
MSGEKKMTHGTYICGYQWHRKEPQAIKIQIQIYPINHISACRTTKYWEKDTLGDLLSTSRGIDPVIAIKNEDKINLINHGSAEANACLTVVKIVLIFRNMT